MVPIDVARVRARSLVVLTAACSPALLFVGCGGAHGPAAAQSSPAAAQPSPAVAVGAAQDASAPKALRDTAVSRAALRAGRRACRDRRPAAVLAAALPLARKRGAPPDLLRMAADPPRRVTASLGYARLAGAVYAASLPRSRRADSALGCAYEVELVLTEQRSVSKSKSTNGTSR
jgi:hypothetical protein